ncbi:MAG: hypothetical protein RIF44_09000 [Nitratireductor sp.]
MANELKKRIKILPGMHADVGRKVVEWVRDPATRPKTVAELEAQLSGLAVVDTTELGAVVFIETPMSAAIFRLPPRDMVEASIERASSSTFDLADYQLPGYYDTTAKELGISALELFHSRIGDYTTGECE